MENATKALEMAASVLIGMLIIGMLAFTFTRISEVKQTEENSKAIHQASSVNQYFEAYNRDGVYGSELLSLVNKVIDYNIKAREEGYANIELTIKFSSLPQNMNNNIYNSKYKFSLQMQGEKLAESYETLSLDITNKGNTLLTSDKAVNGEKVTKTISQWVKMSRVTLSSYFNNSNIEKIQQYQDICDAQTDLARKVFKQPSMTYDQNNGRITKIVFEEK